MKKSIRSALMLGALTLAPVAASGQADAAAQDVPISGTVDCHRTSFLTSGNLRYLSSGSTTVKAKLSDAGTGGVALRVKWENTGAVSSTKYYPPLDTLQTLGSNSGGQGSAFRFQFKCQNNPSNSSSVWNGTANY
ncbi:MAG: hypothetical protein ABMA25_09745 [Ilumatobacteraceae bacterium]